MDDLDALLADLQSTTISGPPQSKSPVYAEPFRPPASTKRAQEPLGGAPVDNISVSSVPLAPDYSTNSEISDDYAQELARLKEPSRSSNIEDLDNLLDDLTTTQNTYTPGRPDNVEPHPDRVQSTTSATHDLEQLMDSLSDFKTTSTSAQPNTTLGYDNLDGMMASLDENLTKKGVQIKKRGECAACFKIIVGQMVTALGKTWHPEHFICHMCKVELGTGKFFERDDVPFCERDYNSLFAPRCAYCEQPIVDKCITALQKTWHPEHFLCVHCKKPFTNTEYHVYEGKPYCSRDYYEMFAPRCSGCNKAIVNNVITALKQQWHVECFVCYECKNRFGAGTYYELDGKPYCEIHYHQHRGSLCAACNKPISGRVITAMRNKFHPEHFVCAFCIQQLSGGTFKEHENKPYCHTCYQKLFGQQPR